MKIKLIIFYASIITVLSFLIYPFLVVLMSIWFYLVIYIFKRNLDRQLLNVIKKIIHYIALAYPLVELGLKFLIIRNVVPYSWSFLNRGEHFMWAFSLTILIYPILYKTHIKLRKSEWLIFSIGLVTIVGVGNELFEYVARLKMGFTDIEHFSVYYNDTIWDLFINFLGSITGSVILLCLTSLHLPPTVVEK